MGGWEGRHGDAGRASGVCTLLTCPPFCVSLSLLNKQLIIVPVFWNKRASEKTAVLAAADRVQEVRACSGACVWHGWFSRLWLAAPAAGMLLCSQILPLKCCTCAAKLPWLSLLPLR